MQTLTASVPESTLFSNIQCSLGGRYESQRGQARAARCYGPRGPLRSCAEFRGRAAQIYRRTDSQTQTHRLTHTHTLENTQMQTCRCTDAKTRGRRRTDAGALTHNYWSRVPSPGSPEDMRLANRCGSGLLRALQRKKVTPGPLCPCPVPSSSQRDQGGWLDAFLVKIVFIQ